MVKFQILSFENLFIEILLSIEKIPNRNRLTKAIEQIQKWQVLAVSCIHAFSSPSSYFLLHLTIFLYYCISRYGEAIRWVVNSACHRFEPVTDCMYYHFFFSDEYFMQHLIISPFFCICRSGNTIWSGIMPATAAGSSAYHRFEPVAECMYNRFFFSDEYFKY